MDTGTVGDVSLRRQQSYFYRSRCALPSASNYIRLVRLSAADDCTSPLRCVFQTCSIQNTPSYIGLSYAWGTQDKSSSIFAQMIGDSWPQSSHPDLDIRITPSLEVCLRHLRSASEDLTLWIDQLCIDQDNIAEKEAQVLLMSHIYREAQYVIAWIGPAENGSDIVMEKWKAIGEIAVELGVDRALVGGGIRDLTTAMMTANGDSTPQQIDALLIKAITDLEGLADPVLHFSLRPWFRRIWVVQEVSLAKSVVIHCGNQSANMQLLADAMYVYTLARAKHTYLGISRTADNMEEIDYYPLMKLIGSRNKVQYRLQQPVETTGLNQPLWHFLEFLNFGDGMEATDPRDRVFAIFALASDGIRLGIRPDYGSTVETVYTRTARIILTQGDQFSGGERGPRIDFLRCCRRLDGEASVGLPSWVPDLRHLFARSFYGERIGDFGAGTSLFRAGGPAKTSEMVLQTDPLDETLIGFKGYYIDTIETVGKAWLGIPPRSGPLNRRVIHEELWTPLAFIHEVHALCLRAVEKQVSNAHLEDRGREDRLKGLQTAPWSVPCGDVALLPYASDSERATSTWEEAYVAYVASLECAVEQDPVSKRQLWEMATGRSQVEKQRLTQLARDYYIRMMHMRKMKPYITRKGYVGMAPMEAEPGDAVVVILGGSLPFITRTLGDDSDNNKLIGEAYCHSMMDGQALEYGVPVQILLV